MPVGVRRLAAFGIDYLVILVWIALIAAVGFLARSRFGIVSGERATTGDKLVGHAVSFVALTLPVVLYFAGAESASRHATLGKRCSTSASSASTVNPFRAVGAWFDRL